MIVGFCVRSRRRKNEQGLEESRPKDRKTEWEGKPELHGEDSRLEKSGDGVQQEKSLDEAVYEMPAKESMEPRELPTVEAVHELKGDEHVSEFEHEIDRRVSKRNVARR